MFCHALPKLGMHDSVQSPRGGRCCYSVCSTEESIEVPSHIGLAWTMNKSLELMLPPTVRAFPSAQVTESSLTSSLGLPATSQHVSSQQLFDNKCCFSKNLVTRIVQSLSLYPFESTGHVVKACRWSQASAEWQDLGLWDNSSLSIHASSLNIYRIEIGYQSY